MPESMNEKCDELFFCLRIKMTTILDHVLTDFSVDIQADSIDASEFVNSPSYAVGGIEVIDENRDITARNINCENITTNVLVEAESVSINDNHIVINSEMSGNPPSSLTSGIIVQRGNFDPYYFQFREQDQSFVIGEAASLQAVATREDNPISDGVAVWSTSENKFKTYSDITRDSIATKTYVDSEILDAKAEINSDISALNTDSIVEGTNNQYYTDSRVLAVTNPIYENKLTFLSANFTRTGNNIALNTSQHISRLNQITTSGILRTNSTGVLSVDTTSYLAAGTTTSSISEGTNLYFTNARAQLAMSGLYENPLTFSAAFTRSTNAIGIANLGITNAMLAGSIAASKLVLTDINLNASQINAGTLSINRLPIFDGDIFQFGGSTYRVTGLRGFQIQSDSTPDAGKILIGQGTTWSTRNLSGDVTLTSGGELRLVDNSVTTADLQNSSVTLAKIANISANTILGNNTVSSAAPIALTTSQVKSILAYNSSEITESGNLYFTDARARSALLGLYELPLVFNAPLSRSGNTISFGNLPSALVFSNGLNIISNQTNWEIKIGHNVGPNTSNNAHNILFGNSVAVHLTSTSNENIVIGSNAFSNITSGNSNNVVIGHSALALGSSTSGLSNVIAIGSSAGSGLTIASNDVIIGSNTSQLIHGSTTLASRHWSPAADNAVDLGLSNRRWRNAHFIGNVNLTNSRVTCVQTTTNNMPNDPYMICDTSGNAGSIAFNAACGPGGAITPDATRIGIQARGAAGTNRTRVWRNIIDLECWNGGGGNQHLTNMRFYTHVSDGVTDAMVERMRITSNTAATASNDATIIITGGIGISNGAILAGTIRLSSLTSNGFLRTSSGNGTLTVDTSTYESPLTFSTGLTRTSNTITVNSVQNITRLSNLTTAGLVRSDVSGNLSVDTSNYLTANQSITLSGAITGSGSTAITTTLANNAVNTANIINGAVTMAKLEAIPTNQILGNVSASAASPSPLTAAQVKTALAIAQADVSGLTTSSSPSFSTITCTSTSAGLKLPSTTTGSVSGPSSGTVIHNSAQNCISYSNGSIWSQLYPNSIVNQQFYDNNNTMTVNAGSPTFIYAFNYTPKLPNTTFIITFNCRYTVGGSANDIMYVYLAINNEDPLALTNGAGFSMQEWVNASGGGTRSSAALPLTRFFRPNQSTPTQFTVNLYGQFVGNDSVTFRPPAMLTIIETFNA